MQLYNKAKTDELISLVYGNLDKKLDSFDLGTTSKTREEIFALLTHDRQMAVVSAYLTQAESPTGSSGAFQIIAYRFTSTSGYIIATRYTGEMYISIRTTSVFGDWSLLRTKEVSLTTSNYATELSTANTHVGDEVMFNYVNSSIANCASGHFTRMRNSASQWSGVGRLYMDSKYYLVFSMSLSGSNLQFSYIDDSHALQTVSYVPTSAGEWVLFKHN